MLGVFSWETGTTLTETVNLRTQKGGRAEEIPQESGLVVLFFC
jgi:hypothetical protein